jgi:FkbM family methyltransferase
MVAVLANMAQAGRVLLWTRSPSLTRAAMRRGCLADVATLVRAGGSLRAGHLRLGGTDLRIGPADVNAAWHVHHLAPHGWQITMDGDDFLVILSPQALRFRIPRGLLADGLGALIERFEMDEYADLDVRGAVVVDVGAYIGDSTLYLLGRGARHVHAYEPFPQLAAVARENFARNGVADRVTLHTAGVGWPPGPRSGTFDAARSMMSSTSSGGGPDKVAIVDFGSVLQAVRRQHPDARVDTSPADYAAALMRLSGTG